jgi:serine/threonine-protein kinase
MRLVLAAVEAMRTPSILGCLGPDAVTIRFASRMSEDETAEYIYARLAHARAPTALVEPFDPETVNRLYVESEGIPRELHKLASEIFREGEGALATLAAAPRVSEARVVPEPEAPPAPLGPPGVEAEEPAREPVPARQPVWARIPIGGRLAVFALLAVATLLVAIPLLRGGFPWLTATPVADSVVEPPVPVPPPETSVPPALDESVEPIAIEPASPRMEEPPEIAVEPSPPPVEEPPEIAVVPEPAPPVREPERAAPSSAVEPISVSINATPWAEIEIDGDEVGITPMAGVLLAPGEHQFRVRMPDGTVLEQTIRIAPDHRHIAFSQ